MAAQSVEVPAGYTLLAVLVPTARVQDYVDTYAQQGGYDPLQHGSTAAQKATFAKATLAARMDNDVISYKNGLVVSAQMADQKTTIL